MINIEQIKNYIVEQCEYELSYYDIVDEDDKTVNYDGIADFVIDLFMGKVRK